MPNLPLDPDVADTAPSDSVLTVYDEEHIITDPRSACCIWEREPDRARKAFDSHLSRDKWMSRHGYQQLLLGGASA
jgi:hypothetical protein